MAAEIITVTTPELLQQGLDIRKKVFVEEQNVPLDLEVDEFDTISDDVHHLLVQDENGDYVATGRLIYYNNETAKMQRIAVLKEHRQGGYGRILLMALENRARELGLAYALWTRNAKPKVFTPSSVTRRFPKSPSTMPAFPMSA